MPGKGLGIFETLRAGVKSEEEVALSFMFPTTDNYKRLQMMTRHQYGIQPSLAVMGLFRRLYGSKVLRIFQEELNINKIALDGLGRVEGAEIVSARRVARESKDED